MTVRRRAWRFARKTSPKANAINAALGAKVFGVTVRAADLGVDAESISAGAYEFVALLKGRRTFPTITGLPETSLMVTP